MDSAPEPSLELLESVLNSASLSNLSSLEVPGVDLSMSEEGEDNLKLLKQSNYDLTSVVSSFEAPNFVVGLLPGQLLLVLLCKTFSPMRSKAWLFPMHGCTAHS